MLYCIRGGIARRRDFEQAKGSRVMYEQIIEIIAKQLQIAPSKIAEDTDVVEDLGADSLDVVLILLELEQAFSVSIPDEEIAALKTPKDVFNYIAAKKAN